MLRYKMRALRNIMAQSDDGDCKEKKEKERRKECKAKKPPNAPFEASKRTV